MYKDNPKKPLIILGKISKIDNIAQFVDNKNRNYKDGNKSHKKKTDHSNKKKNTISKNTQ